MAVSAVILGDNCIDRYLPPIVEDHVGGQAVNVASHLARAGLSVAYAGTVGSDAAALSVLRELDARGVDTSLVEQRYGATGLTLVEVTPAGERRFVREEYGVSAPYRPSRDALAAATQADIVYGVHLDDMTAIREAITRPTLLAIDASEEAIDTCLVADPDIVFISRPQWSAAEATDLAKDLVIGTVTTAVITLGEAGAVAATSSESATVNAETSQVLDTLGAGDAFAAGFLSALIHGFDLADALHEASHGAAAVCTHRGGYRST